MWKKKKKSVEDNQPLEEKNLTIHEIRKAIHAFADDKPSSVPLGVLIQEDLTLDYQLLAPYLHAKPAKAFYMSKETYELFDEDGYDLAKELDMVQHAVDQYMKQTNDLPVIDADPYKRISYFKLERQHLLKERPKRDFYLTNEEFMITYKKPE